MNNLSENTKKGHIADRKRDIVRLIEDQCKATQNLLIERCKTTIYENI